VDQQSHERSDGGDKAEDACMRYGKNSEHPVRFGVYSP
jgi:hypothetical protein